MENLVCCIETNNGCLILRFTRQHINTNRNRHSISQGLGNAPEFRGLHHHHRVNCDSILEKWKGKEKCVPCNSTRQGWLSGTGRSYLYSTISSMDAHGLEGPWSFQRDLKITLEIKDRKVDPQLPKGLQPQLPTWLQPKWNHMTPHDLSWHVIPLGMYSWHVSCAICTSG